MKKIYSRCLVLLLLSCATVVVNAQKTITGTVKEAVGPIPGVSVLIKGTSRATQTDKNGQFSISANPADVLVFSAIGYSAQEISVGDKSTINVTLKENANELAEVQIVGALGIIKEDKNLGYAVTTVKGEDITRTNTVNPITALQGKIAGVNVNVVGAAGIQTSPFIQIRGAKVLGSSPGQANNQPIFVVDGNVLQNNLISADGTDAGSQLKNLNPDDYASITVLKGAAATSLYGSRGLNGAIVITTKKGKAGSGLGIEFTSTYQTSNIYRSPMEFQNTYGQGSAVTREGNFAADGSQANTVGSWGPAFDGSIHPVIYDHSRMTPYVSQPENWKAFYQDGNYVNNNISLSGASDKFNYRLSYSNNASKGMLPNNGLNRNAFDIKLGGDLNKVFSTEIGINYANTITKNYYGQGRYEYGGGTNLGFNTYYLPRNLNFSDWRATYRNADNSLNNAGAFGNLSSVINAFSRFDKNNFNRNENSFLGFAQLKAQINPWIDLSARGNVNFLKIYEETKNYGNDKNNAGGYYSTAGNYATDYTLLFMAHGAKKVMSDDLNIDLRVVNEIYGNGLAENYGVSTNGGLAVPNQFFPANSVNPIQNNYYYNFDGYPGARPSNTKTIGLAGILNLNYKDYLNLEITGRNDWLSTLTYPNAVNGANNYSVFYPSINLAYGFYDQFKESMPNFLSSGRLRASIAYVGNAGVAGPYATGAGFAPGTIFNNASQGVSSASQINADVKPNLDLKPQRQRSLEFGTNIGFLKELINVDFTYYKTNTFDQLLYVPSVIETGFSRSFLNLGNIQNQGIELLVNVTPIRKNGWNWNVAVNLAHNKSKIKELGNGIKEWEVGGGYDGANVWAYEGGDFGVLTADNGSSSLIDTKTGLPVIRNSSRYTNTNPTVKYDIADYSLVSPTYSDDQRRVKIGKVEPNLTGGVSSSLRYKNFNLFAQVDGRFGGYVYSEALSYASGQGTSANTLQFRDQAHGGVARTDSYTGQTRYDGVIPNAVFEDGQESLLKPGTSIGGMTFRQAYDQGLVEPWKASLYYNTWYGYGTNLNVNETTSKNSWIMLREVTLGYSLPNSIVEKIKLRGARISVSGRDLGYFYKTLAGGQNPASIQSNDPFRPFITGGVPFFRNYSVSLNVTL